jgi:hypothetical protein
MYKLCNVFFVLWHILEISVTVKRGIRIQCYPHCTSKGKVKFSLLQALEGLRVVAPTFSRQSAHRWQ